MAEQPGLAIAVLAAGQSRRFGAADKLTAKLDGKLLGLHAADALSGIAATHHWVIVSRADHPCADSWRAAGFDISINPQAEQGMGTSVALAAKLASDVGADALLIALADMPFVTAEHFAALAACATPSALSASHNGAAPTPPAIFGQDHFPALMQSHGDWGAGALLKKAEIIACLPEQLRDVDVPKDLTKPA